MSGTGSARGFSRRARLGFGSTAVCCDRLYSKVDTSVWHGVTAKYS